MGLSLFEEDTVIKITCLGASGYKRYGWATETEIPLLSTVAQANDFFLSEGDIGLMEFEVELNGFGTLYTYDDCKSRFLLNTKRECFNVMKEVVIPEYRDMIINKLIQNQGLYISCSSRGVVAKYRTFDEYLAKNA